jgi:hypothetical protein
MFAVERGSVKAWIEFSLGVVFLVTVAQAIVVGSITVGAKFVASPLTFKRSEDPVGFWAMTVCMTLFGIAALLWSGVLRWS